MKRIYAIAGGAVALAGLFAFARPHGSAYQLSAAQVRPAAASRSAEPEHFSGRETFDRLAKLARENDWRKKPVGQMMGEIGLALRGTPYVASTLELYDDREVCSVNLTGLDCVTFFESALDFARTVKKGTVTPEAMMEQVTYTRYRDGRINDYVSRLHYTADWLYDNEEKHVVKVITRELPGAELFTKEVNFMSTHPDAYRQLKANPSLVPKIREVEARINKRRMYYIPKEKVAAIESRLQTGDIIGITTTIPGIDCSHTGICYRDDKGVLHYLHASSTKKQVWLDDELSAYLMSVSKHTGIMVARPVDI
jgi:hypothetical protein